jgi:hypothetical protein
MRAKLSIPILAVATLLVGGSALAFDEKDCPKVDRKATPEQVFASRIAAMQTGDMVAIACTYEEDAVVMFPNQVIRGRDAIMQAFMQFAGVLGGAAPTITSTTTADDVLNVTYEVYTPTVSIPDGSDVFIISKGRIQYQVVNARLVFTQQP